MKKLLKVIISLAIIGCFASGCFAWDDELAGTTEVTGYYQQYRDFSFKTGLSEYYNDIGIYVKNDFDPARLAGGGFSVAQNLAEWFAIWMQLSFYGTVKQEANYGSVSAENSVRIINELQGIRYQTKQYGPFRLYGKVGAGFARYSFIDFGDEAGFTKFSASYGGGVNVWINKNIGITLDASHTLMALPNFAEGSDVKLKSREKFDSGMTYTTGLTFRF